MDYTAEKVSEELEETLVEFTASLKEKLLSPQVREAIDTIEYLVGEFQFIALERYLSPFPAQRMSESLTWKQQSTQALQSSSWP